MKNWYEGEVVGSWRHGDNPVDFLVPFNTGMNIDSEAYIECFDSHNIYHEILHNCSPLAAILYKRAEAFASGKVEVLTRSTGNSVRGINKEWQKLIDRPNWMQTKTEFLQQIHLNVDLFGWCYVLPIYPAGFTDRPKEMWVMPSECITVEPLYTNKAFYKFAEGERMRRLWFNCNGESREIDESELILFKDTKTPIDHKTWLPESRIRSLKYPISKIMAAEEADITLIKKKGAIGFISNEGSDSIGSISMDPDEQKRLQENLGRYGLTRGQYQYIVTNATLKFQSMSVPVKELMLHETYLQAVKDLCDAYNFPMPLSSHSDQSTYNNIAVADRQLIQGIIPEAKVFFEQFDNGVDAVDNNIEIWVDYSEHPALQATSLERAQALIAQNSGYQTLYMNNMMTPNQWLEKIGENKVANPDFDLYYYQRGATVEANDRATANQATKP